MSVRIALYSDLHLEHPPAATDLAFPADPGDVIVLAGDIDTKRRGVRWARRTFGDRPVVYVGGNHEPYGDKLPNTLTALKEEGATCDVHVLENDAVVLGGVRFLGCTFWTDCRFFARSPEEAPAYGVAESEMNDYRKIRVAPTFRRLYARDTVAMHERSRRWLAAQLATPFDGPTVIVTHHAPSARSVPAHQLTDPATLAYASRLDEVVAASGAALWVHGHTHYNVDYALGATRVVTNQRGYWFDRARGDGDRRFDAGFTITLDTPGASDRP